MIRINQIKINIDPNRKISDKERDNILCRKITRILRVQEKDIAQMRIAKHSIDARKKPELFDVYVVDVYLTGLDEGKAVRRSGDRNVSLLHKEEYDFFRGAGDSGKGKDKRIVIVGSGPAGLFCGYELAVNGFKPVILERGADIDRRTDAVDKFWNGEELSPDTNVQFGEGGAGTFSDGKLNTVVKDKEGRGERVLDIFTEHGAPENIKYESKPHIGTDVLRRVVKNIRNRFIEEGGEIFFDTKVTALELDENKSVRAVLAGDKRFLSDMVVLAIGHSARDTFAMLHDLGVSMQPKPFAVGFRVEHPQKLINRSQYGIMEAKALPAAPYKLTATTGSGRGVYSFCMCPGGYVVNASSEEGHLAVNGMSYNARDGRNANSAIIITVDPKDFGQEGVLSGVEFQRKLERKAFELAGGRIPVERYRDFKRAALPSDDAEYIDSSFDDDMFVPQMKGSYEYAAVHEILPDELGHAFVEGMESFGRVIKGYNDGRALISGIESRTSSPVRIMRDKDCVSENVPNLYPCGEGAGYAGGIMSAAMDGIRIAQMIAKRSRND